MTTSTLTECPSWCSTPAHRLLDTQGMPTREDLDLAAYEPHEGPVYGPSRSRDVEVLAFVHPDGTSGVSVNVGGNLALTLPLSRESVARLETMSDALRGASEDLFRVLVEVAR